MARDEKEMPLKKAREKFQLSGTRLMMMHTAEGKQWFLIPGGRVSSQFADECMRRPDVAPFDDGLFPGNPQSWKIG